MPMTAAICLEASPTQFANLVDFRRGSGFGDPSEPASWGADLPFSLSHSVRPRFRESSSRRRCGLRLENAGRIKTKQGEQYEIHSNFETRYRSGGRLATGLMDHGGRLSEE